MESSSRPRIASAGLSLLLVVSALRSTCSAPAFTPSPSTAHAGTLTASPRAAAAPEDLGPLAPAVAATTEASPVASPPKAPPMEEEEEAEEDEEEEEEEESGRAVAGGDKVLRALSDRLYESCVQKDTLACLGLKAFYATARFAEAPEALAQVSSRRARLREATADRVLVGSAAVLLSKSLRRARESLASEDAHTHPATEQEEAEEEPMEDKAEAKLGEEEGEENEVEATDDESKENFATDRRRAGLPFTRKMLFPLLIGIVLKLTSLIPLILGKLTIIGTMSLMSSKLSLLILMLMSLRKWLGGGESSAPAQVVSEAPYYSQHAAPPAYAHGYADAHAYESQTHLAATPADYSHPHVHMPAGAVHPGALHGPYRRVYRTHYMVRGRQLGGDEDWQPRTTQDMQAEDRAAEELATEAAAARAAEVVSEAGANTEAVIENSNSSPGSSSTTDTPSSGADGPTDAPPPPTPLSVAVSAPAPDAAAVTRTSRRRTHHEETSTSGFSVSNEDTESEVRRLDEVEGRIVAH